MQRRRSKPIALVLSLALLLVAQGQLVDRAARSSSLAKNHNPSPLQALAGQRCPICGGSLEEFQAKYRFWVAKGAWLFVRLIT